MKIFVTGMGVISSIGNDLNENFNSLKNEKGGISYGIEPEHIPLYAGRIKRTNEKLKKYSGVTSDEITNRSTILGLIAAKEAWDNRALHSEIRTGIVAGTSFGQSNLSDVFIADSLDKKKEFLNTHDYGASTDFIANQLNIFGHRSTISTACSSSANAIMFGARLIEANILDCVLVGGADSVNEYTMEGFYSMLLYDNEQCKPFDNNRNGLNLGEAGAFLVIENEKSIALTKQEKLAELIGWANTCDSFHQTGSSPDGKGATLAMEKALRKANLSHDAIDYINAHGTGTKNNDISESIAMQNVFGHNVPAFSSTKSYTGHTLSAAGSLEAVFSILSIQNDMIFPSLNCKTPMKEVSFGPERHLVHNKKINKVLSNSFGFGGNCTALLFSK